MLQHVEEKGISKNVSQKSFLLSLPFLPSGREADLTAVCREEFLAILTYSYLLLGSMIFEYGDWFFLMGKNSSYPKLNMYISERKKESLIIKATVVLNPVLDPSAIQIDP